MTRFEQALVTAHNVFKNNAFRKWNGAAFERRINRAVFDVVTRYFSDNQIAKRAEERPTEIIEVMKSLCSESEMFRNSIERTTKTPSATQIRHRLWGEKLALVIGGRLDEKTMRMS